MLEQEKIKISINENIDILASAGESLLSSLRKNNIFIPAACGGRSMCGYCKLKIVKGAKEPSNMDKKWIEEDELEEGYRLACQFRPKEDISIEIEEKVMEIKSYTGKVIEIKQLTDRIKKFIIELPKGDNIKYKPGQFVQVQIPPYEKTEDYKKNPREIYRSFSLASDNEDSNIVELIIGFTGGFGTTYLHKILKVGDELTFNGPQGYFYYKEEDNDIILSATGTGYSPIRAILYYMRDKNITRKSEFFFGARTKEDLFLKKEMKMFEEELENFSYYPTLSRPEEKCDWVGDVGRVNNSIDKYIDKDGNYSAYLCGSKRVIDSLVESLENKNISEDKIYYDKF